MNEINTQRELANEISDAISNPAFAGFEVDEVFQHISHTICLCITGASVYYLRMSSRQS